MPFRRIASLRDLDALRAYCREQNISLPAESLTPAAISCFAQPLPLSAELTAGNRFAVLPMEGWDGTREGKPSALTERRWQRFGRSGAKLIWGGEAVAVRHDGRANPNQLLISPANLNGLHRLRRILLQEHADHFGTSDDVITGLQLTHSGRFSRPNRADRPEPIVLFHNPETDRRLGKSVRMTLLSDDDIKKLSDDFIAAAVLAQKAGYHFVDIKMCHGYLGHDFLNAVSRPGEYGGSLENRTRFLRRIVAGIRACAPGLEIGVRLSAFDFIPFHAGENGLGVPDASAAHLPFGCDSSGTGVALEQPSAFLSILEEIGIRLVCISAGTPYTTPHLLRPALFPPSDGYAPPEDPLAGVARLIRVTAELKRRHPGLVFVGSGYSYLQEFIPHVAAAVLAAGGADSIGLGRMMLSYPDFIADVLAGKPVQRKRVCRTFSDCTTAPRNGFASGCYPLDPFYSKRPEADRIRHLRPRLPRP